MMRMVMVVFCLLLMAPMGAQAGESKDWQAVQGDIVMLHHAAATTVTVFGQQWPLQRQADGSVRAWVGVDLARKPGRYPVHWQQGSGTGTQFLQVTAGHFRVSRITVKRSMAVFNSEQLGRIRYDQRLLRVSYKQPVARHANFSFPAMPISGIISTPFGAKRFVNGAPRSPHSGVDIAAAAGTPIHVPVAGRVVLVASMYLNGNTVVVAHGDGLVEIFSHLSNVDVFRGDRLRAGQLIGLVGATGRATGPHLHWGLRFAGARVTPLSLLPAALSP
ncbi:MAG: M23 family metallopeptidase [Mariprofundales bacterium]|nr:M23 family metallopeptidase [Mariprofundales bacterium]